jgi:uncharacterized protein involved in response to NO
MDTSVDAMRRAFTQRPDFALIAVKSRPLCRAQESAMIQAAHFPAFFQVGLRPFFLGAALWAPISLLLWLAALAGAVDLPTALPPLAWHSHELVFGYAGAVVAGFLLTAVPNWTARPPSPAGRFSGSGCSGWARASLR